VQGEAGRRHAGDHSKAGPPGPSWASSNPPDSDADFILPVPSTGLEAPSDHLTGRRRKTKLVLVVILATMAMGSRGALWKRERILWQDYCGSMLRSEFSRMFRMDPLTFAYLVVALSPRIDRNFVQAENAGGYISPELRVAMTIRWLAGGSYLDLKVHMGVATSTFYNIAEDVCDAIIETFPIKFDTSLLSMSRLYATRVSVSYSCPWICLGVRTMHVRSLCLRCGKRFN
jgi:hypothetical protein